MDRLKEGKSTALNKRGAYPLLRRRGRGGSCRPKDQLNEKEVSLYLEKEKENCPQLSIPAKGGCRTSQGKNRTIDEGEGGSLPSQKETFLTTHQRGNKPPSKGKKHEGVWTRGERKRERRCRKVRVQGGNEKRDFLHKRKAHRQP